MTTVAPAQAGMTFTGSQVRAHALAERLESGVRALATLATRLTDVQWGLAMPHDGRPVGVIVHHVASVLPIEITLAQTVAAGTPVTGVTPADINQMNAAHAREHAAVTRGAAVDLLLQNGAAAAAAIRSLVRHSYHHLARIRAALNR